MHQLEVQTVRTSYDDRLFSVNPNTGEILGVARISSKSDVEDAVRRARLAQRSWAKRSLQQRIAVIQPIQEGLVARAADLTKLISQEMGKTETDTLIGDILLTLVNLAGTLKIAPQALCTQRLRSDLLHVTKRTYIVREPIGVVAVISPFNFPLLLSLQTSFAALIAGNAVVHKPSEHTPLTALKVRDMMVATGLPPDLFQVVIGSGETGRELVQAGVDHISFCGSSETGRQVAAAAGAQLIPVTLELGGNNAMIVLDDAPLERAINCALAFAFAANGQMCGSISRLYLHETIAADFVRGMVKRLESWRISTAIQPGGGDVTSLISEEAYVRAEEAIRSAAASGARIVIGGERQSNTTKPLLSPTILMDTTPDMRVMRDEIFGPVLCVVRVNSDEQAVRQANDSLFGLTASIWTRDKARAWDIARRLNVATVAVNDHLWPFFAPEVPWGGIRASGLGRVGGIAGLQAMTYPKVVSFDRLNLPREVYWYPRPRWLHLALMILIPLLFSRRPLKHLLAGAASHGVPQIGDKGHQANAISNGQSE